MGFHTYRLYPAMVEFNLGCNLSQFMLISDSASATPAR